jgi:hypothetical protein
VCSCDWCLLDFNITTDFGGEVLTINTATCVSNSATIAPIPSSILASLSRWNVSYAGFLATALNLRATGLSFTSTQSQISTVSVLSVWTHTYTYYGGGAPTISTPGSSRATGSAPTATKAAANANGAESWRRMMRIAVITWTSFFSISLLYAHFL